MLWLFMITLNETGLCFREVNSLGKYVVLGCLGKYDVLRFGLGWEKEK